MNEPLELESRPARQQNYQFAYHLVPQFLFRSDFASTIPMAHPRGFEYWEKMWAKMAVAYPAEHLVQADGISSQAYHISKNTYALLVALPAADYSMEVSHLIIVFRPDIEYFVLGNGVDANSPSTLRKVDTSKNARCGGVFKLSDSEILEAVCSSLGLEPDIRLADDDEFRALESSVPSCSVPSEELPFNDVWQVGVTYRVLSAIVGDTTNMSPMEVGQLAAQMPPQVHAFAGVCLQLLSKPDVSRAEMDALFETNAGPRRRIGPWIVLGLLLIAMCIMVEIARRLVPGPNPNPAPITGGTIVIAGLGVASLVYAVISYGKKSV